MQFPLVLRRHLYFYLVVRFEVNIRLPVKHSVQHRVNVKFIPKNIRVHLHIVNYIVKCILSWKFDGFILFDFVHDFDHNDERPVAGVSIHSNFKLGSVVVGF